MDTSTGVSKQTIIAVIVATIGTLVALLVYSIVWVLIALFLAMTSQVPGIFLLIMGSCLAGCGPFISIYVTLRIFNHADSTVTAGIIIGLLILYLLLNLILMAAPLPLPTEIIFLLLATLSSVLGCAFSKLYIDRYREGMRTQATH